MRKPLFLSLFLICSWRQKGWPDIQRGLSLPARSPCLCSAWARVEAYIEDCVCWIGLGTLGCRKRRCFQSDRASSVFTQRLLRRLTFLLDVSLLGAPRTPPTARTSGRPLTAVYCSFTDAAGISGQRTCGCSCPDGEDLNHISCCSRVMLRGDKGQRSTRMTRLSLLLR